MTKTKVALFIWDTVYLLFTIENSQGQPVPGSVLAQYFNIIIAYMRHKFWRNNLRSVQASDSTRWGTDHLQFLHSSHSLQCLVTSSWNINRATTGATMKTFVCGA